MTEDILQSQCFLFAWNTYPETRRCFFHVANETDRVFGETKQSHIQRIMKLKAKGVVPGVHDNIFLWQGVAHSIELKVGRNGLSTHQERFTEAWTKQGGHSHVAYTLEEFKQIFIGIITNSSNYLPIFINK